MVVSAFGGFARGGVGGGSILCYEGEGEGWRNMGSVKGDEDEVFVYILYASICPLSFSITLHSCGHRVK